MAFPSAGWHEPSPRRSPVVEGPPGLGCSLEDHPYPPTCTLDPVVGRSRPAAPPCWSLFGEEWSGHGPALSLYLPFLRASVSSPPSYVRVTIFPSLYPSVPCVVIGYFNVACSSSFLFLQQMLSSEIIKHLLCMYISTRRNINIPKLRELDITGYNQLIVYELIAVPEI